MSQIISKYHLLSCYLTSIVWSHSPATRPLAVSASASILCGFLTIRRSHGLTSLTWSEPVTLHLSSSVTAQLLPSSHLSSNHNIYLCVCSFKHCHLRGTLSLSLLGKFACFFQTHLITPRLCPCQGWGWWGQCWGPWSWAWSQCPWCRLSALPPPVASTPTVR